MCGIVGVLTAKPVNAELECSQVERMVENLKHRGPDSSGIWFDKNTGVFLGHSRLSILDLTSSGAQPMQSSSGRFVIVINGEVYNYKELRRQLDSRNGVPPWRGSSDTEVVLECIETWGLEKALKSFTGMFAMAIWDQKDKELYIARDRAGEKPLYYGFQDTTWFFGSELTAITVHKRFEAKISMPAISMFIKHGYVPGDITIYEGVFKLEPGTYLRLGDERPVRYWNVVSDFSAEPLAKRKGKKHGSILDLEQLIIESVEQQMRSDVPVGAFLSGGIDSSLVTAIMADLAPGKIQTFTIGFENQNFNEAAYAKKIAEYLKTDHHELYVSDSDCIDLVNGVHDVFDEPFADPSQVPTLILSSFARKTVKVALTGDGGDELFHGYTRYHRFASRWAFFGRVPQSIKNGVASLITSSIFFGPLGRFISKDRTERFRRMLMSMSIEDLYEVTLSHVVDPNAFLIHKQPENHLYPSKITQELPNISSVQSKLGYLDFHTYLADDLLVKVDRCAMAHSLETRTPLLSRKIINCAMAMPSNLKTFRGESKYCLRQLLRKRLPAPLFERKKMGFGIPISTWLRGPLRGWCDELLSKNSIEQFGILDYESVNRLWQQHKDQRIDWGYQIWILVSLQAWLKSHL